MIFAGVITTGDLISYMLFALQTVFAFQSLLSIFPQFMEAIGASVRVFELLDRVPRVNYDGECFALMDPVISTRYGLRISCIFTLNS